MCYFLLHRKLKYQTDLTAKILDGFDQRSLLKVFISNMSKAGGPIFVIMYLCMCMYVHIIVYRFCILALWCPE